jgi:hypothetical protein
VAALNPELPQDFVLKLAFVTSQQWCGNLANCCRTAMRKKYFDHDGLIEITQTYGACVAPANPTTSAQKLPTVAGEDARIIILSPRGPTAYPSAVSANSDQDLPARASSSPGLAARPGEPG